MNDRLKYKIYKQNGKLIFESLRCNHNIERNI